MFVKVNPSYSLERSASVAFFYFSSKIWFAGLVFILSLAQLHGGSTKALNILSGLQFFLQGEYNCKAQILKEQLRITKGYKEKGEGSGRRTSREWVGKEKKDPSVHEKGLATIHTPTIEKEALENEAGKRYSLDTYY